MLTKLLKYEWKATGRVILPIAGGVLVLNLVSSLLGHFVNNTGNSMPWVVFLTALLTLATFLGMLAVLAVCFFASVQRYYKLLGEQGYLMLSCRCMPGSTLPPSSSAAFCGRCSAFFISGSAARSLSPRWKRTTFLFRFHTRRTFLSFWPSLS